MLSRTSNPRTPVLFIALLLAASQVFATDTKTGRGTFEIYAGRYISDSPLDDEPTFGVRGSYRFSDRWGVEGTYGRAGLIDLAFTVGNSANLAEVSAQWFANPGRRAEVFLYGGGGIAAFDSEVRILRDHSIPGFLRHETVSSNTIEVATLHAGVGVAWSLTKRLYLRPDLRARWLDDFADSGIDLEANLGIGWKFGNR